MVCGRVCERANVCVCVCGRAYVCVCACACARARVIASGMRKCVSVCVYALRHRCVNTVSMMELV